MSARILSTILALALAGCAPTAVPLQKAETYPATDPLAWKAACKDFDEWDKPGPAYRIYGNAYYVGTCGISSILLTGPEGHILIDSGTDEGAKVVLANIASLGFDPRDVRYILMSHEHFDHVGGMARLQAATGATIVTSSKASEVLRTGLTSPADPQADSDHPPFPPVTGPIRIVDDEAPIQLVGRMLQPVQTPGHSPGAMSWRWDEVESDTVQTIVYADSLNPISSDSYRFTDHPHYLGDFRRGLNKISAIGRCLLVSPHPSSSGMRDRIAEHGLSSNSQQACTDYANTISARLDERIANEATAQ